jgi:hypothetical protein
MPLNYYFSNRTDDWRTPTGDIVPAPATDAESLFSTAYSYCVDNWCAGDVSESLFTYGSGESFQDINKCDVPFSSEVEVAVQEIVDDPTVNQDLSAACGGSLPCLVDGVCGGIADAIEALDNERVIVETQVEVKTSIFPREETEVVDVVALPEVDNTTTTTSTTTPPTSTETADNFWYPAWGKGLLDSVCFNDGESPQHMKMSGEHPPIVHKMYRIMYDILITLTHIQSCDVQVSFLKTLVKV